MANCSLTRSKSAIRSKHQEPSLTILSSLFPFPPATARNTFTPRSSPSAKVYCTLPHSSIVEYHRYKMSSLLPDDYMATVAYESALLEQSPECGFDDSSVGYESNHLTDDWYVEPSFAIQSV